MTDRKHDFTIIYFGTTNCRFLIFFYRTVWCIRFQLFDSHKFVGSFVLSLWGLFAIHTADKF